MSGEVVEDRRDGAGDAALHVYCAAAIELFAGGLTSEWRMLPCCLVARRNHVGMTGEDEVRGRRSDAGVEIFDGVGAGFTECHPMDSEAGGLQCLFQKRKCATFRRSDRRAAKQIAGNGDRIGGHGWWCL